MNQKPKYGIRWTLVILGIIWGGPIFSQANSWNMVDMDLPNSAKNDLAEIIYQTGDGAIWMGFTQAGLYRYNGYSWSNIDPVSFGLESNSLNRVISMSQLDNGNLLLGSRDYGVTQLNYEDKKGTWLINTESPEINEALRRIWYYHEDDNGIIWMASWRGLVKYNPKAMDYDLFRFPFNTPRNDGMNPSIFRCIQPDPGDPDILWITGITGLFSFKKREQTFTHHRHPEILYRDGHRDFNMEHRQYLMTDMEIQGDDLYMSSWGGGILHFNKKTNSWKNYLFRDYFTQKTLDENICNQISIQGDQLIFTAVPESGILDLTTHEIQFFDYQENQSFYNGYALLKDRYENHWMSSYQNGVFIGNRKDIPGSRPDSLFFEFYQVKLEGELIRDFGNYDYPNILEMPPDKDSLQLEFALINPYEVSEVEYQFKIAGYTNDWISNGRQNTILLSKLPKGKHELFIRAREGQDKWSSSAPLVINRKVYFYKQPIWWILFGAVLISIIAFWIRQRVKRKIEKESKDKQLVELKMQALQAQMNPHFIFNALNSVNTYILKNEPEKASDFLDLFSKLIRKILNNSDKPMVSLGSDIDVLKTYIDIEHTRFGEKFDYFLNVADDIDEKNCQVPPLIIQPYVENAIWHGLMQLDRKGSLWINYSRQGDHLQIEVIDDGIGRKKSKSTRSSFKKDKPVGMDLAGNRVDVFQKMFGDQVEIFLADKNPEIENTGTIVRVKIPYILQKSSTLGSD